MKQLPELFEQNKQWVEEIKRGNPDYFAQLAQQQTPQYLWIGCSDSRVPATQITGLKPGEIFVHRNIANVVVNTDLNLLSVLQYAVEVLKVKHVIVCGHYGCGGVKAAMSNQKFGLIDNWLRNIKDIFLRHKKQVEACSSEEERFDKLCELNVIEQVNHVCHTTIVQDAWDRGQELTIHGWIYDIKDGLLRDLDTCISSKEQIRDIYRTECD